MRDAPCSICGVVLHASWLMRIDGRLWCGPCAYRRLLGYPDVKTVG